MRYRIGLDVGITSVGWAVIEDNEEGEPVRIEKIGARIFDAAEVAKTGAALAMERREARGARRRNRRKTHRIARTKNLLLRYDLIEQSKLDTLYTNKEVESDVYTLRVAGLDRKLRDNELARVLIHFMKRRGYKSSSKSEENSKENGKALTAVSENKRLMLEKGYRSVAELYLKDDKFKLRIENGETICDSDGVPIVKIRNTTNDYKTTMGRELIIEEVQNILKTQQKYNTKITDDFIEKYIEIFSSQRSFDEGPSSKYGGNLIENMLGNCTFIKTEKRAPKATFTFELFKLLQDLNNIKIEKVHLVNSINDNVYHKRQEKRELTFDEKQLLLEEWKGKSELKYPKVRKILNLPYDEIFNNIDYDFRKLDSSDEKSIQCIIDETEKNTKQSLKEFQSFHEMRKALDKYEKGYITRLNEDTIDQIATILTLYKSDNKRIEELKQLNLDENAIPYLLPLSFSKPSHLSIAAMKRLIPYLKEGMRYDEAATKEFSDFRRQEKMDKKTRLSLQDMENITNPVVRRGVSQTLKVINAIILQYGKPEMVNIELAREISKNFEDRKKIQKENEENKDKNEKIVKQIQELCDKDNVKGQDIVKFKLWQEQDGICPYSGEKISVEELFTQNVDIDHIIPYSKCFDDSYKNKVLVKANENRMKSNRTPLEYILDTNRDVEAYIGRIEAMYSNNRIKRRNLLKEHFTSEDEEEWKNRNLKDTQYMARILLNFIRENLEFENNENIHPSKRVNAVKGKMSHEIAKRYGFQKIRENDRHHAMDAAIIAITTNSMIQKITNYYKHLESRDDRDQTKIDYFENFPMPYPYFAMELKAMLKETDEEVERALKPLNILKYQLEGYPKAMFISRMPKRKVKGKAHMDTIYGISNIGKLVNKVPLTNLKLDKFGEIKDYYNKQDDKLLYEALKKRLITYDGDANKAFKEPFFKPKSDGEKGPLVKKVKIESKSSSHVLLSNMHGAANNDKRVRVDVFYVENEGYYMVPIYVADTIKNKLPNLAYPSLKIMDDTNFIFSIYPNDLVYIEKSNIRLRPKNKESKREEKVVEELLGYFAGFDITTGAIDLETHDRTYYQHGIGVKNLKALKKYQVDVLGQVTSVKIPEARVPFDIKK